MPSDSLSPLPASLLLFVRVGVGYVCLGERFIHQRLLSVLHRFDTIQAIIADNEFHFTTERLAYFLDLKKKCWERVKRERELFYDAAIDLCVRSALPVFWAVVHVARLTHCASFNPV